MKFSTVFFLASTVQSTTHHLAVIHAAVFHARHFCMLQFFFRWNNLNFACFFFKLFKPPVDTIQTFKIKTATIKTKLLIEHELVKMRFHYSVSNCIHSTTLSRLICESVEANILCFHVFLLNFSSFFFFSRAVFHFSPVFKSMLTFCWFFFVKIILVENIFQVWKVSKCKCITYTILPGMQQNNLIRAHSLIMRISFWSKVLLNIFQLVVRCKFRHWHHAGFAYYI